MSANTIDFNTIAPSDELDLSGEGVVSKEQPLDITNVVLEEPAAGNKRYAITFEGPELGFPTTERFWIEHSNPKAKAAGRSQLKRLAVAATGSPKFSPGSLQGRRVLGTPKENDEGFTHISRFKSADGTEPVIGE